MAPAPRRPELAPTPATPPLFALDLPPSARHERAPSMPVDALPPEVRHANSVGALGPSSENPRASSCRRRYGRTLAPPPRRAYSEPVTTLERRRSLSLRLTRCSSTRARQIEICLTTKTNGVYVLRLGLRKLAVWTLAMLLLAPASGLCVRWPAAASTTDAFSGPALAGPARGALAAAVMTMRLPGPHTGEITSGDPSDDGRASRATSPSLPGVLRQKFVGELTSSGDPSDGRSYTTYVAPMPPAPPTPSPPTARIAPADDALSPPANSTTAAAGTMRASIADEARRDHAEIHAQRPASASEGGLHSHSFGDVIRGQAIDEFGFSVVHGLGIDDDGTLIGLVSNLLHGAVKHSDSSEQLRGHIKKTATRAVASLLMHKAVGAALALAAYLHLSSLFGFVGE